MFSVDGYAVPKGTKTIKIINEIEEIGGEYIVYMTDDSSYHISQLMTVIETAKLEGCEI